MCVLMACVVIHEQTDMTDAREGQQKAPDPLEVK